MDLTHDSVTTPELNDSTIMQKSFPVIATLLVSTVSAFCLGWVLKPAPTPIVSTNHGPDVAAVANGGSLTPLQRIRSAESLAASKSHPTIARYIKGGTVRSQDMGTAIKAMMKENDPLKKNAMLSALLDSLTSENAMAAFEALRDSRGNRRGGFGRGGGGNEMRLLLNAWGRIDGKTAVAELTALAEAERAEREANGDNGRGGRGRGDRSGRDGGGFFDIYSALSGWATTDAKAALEYVNTLEGDDRRKGMYTSGIVRGLMANGVDDAIRFITDLPEEDNNSRGRYMGTVAEEMLEDGAASAAIWVDSLKADDLKGGAMDRIAGAYAREDLESAIEWVGKHAGEAYARSAVVEVAEQWAENDPQGVIEWASDLPESTQQRVFEEALDEWTERDPVAASEYLAQMTDSPVKDSAVEGFAKELAREDPPSAAVWAATIGDEELRTSTLQEVARDWVRKDRAAAEAWLPTSGLSQEAQQQVLENQGRGGFDRFGGRRGRGGR